MGFSSVKSYVNSLETGRCEIANFRKVLTAIGVTRTVFDVSQSAGNPRPNFYASTPLESAVLNGNYGLFHGPDSPSGSKHISKITLQNNLAAATNRFSFYLLDYIMYYPFIDGDSTDEQLLTNSVTLPRYESGEGVQAVLIAQGSYVGGQFAYINYTNSDGVSGRVSTPFLIDTITNSTTVCSPFCIPLNEGDKGIRSVESITFLGVVGGIHALVLIKPLGTITASTIGTATEKDFFLETGNLPKIYNGAYLNFFAVNNSNNASVGQIIQGTIETVWGND